MPFTLRRAIALSALAPLALSAQVAREHDPTRLTNWPAPLYWQPSATPETAATPQAATTSLPLGSAALVFVAMTPCRVMDTRTGQGFTGAFGPPSIAAGLPVRTIPIQSSTTCSIPSLARAYSFNITVVPPASLLYITLYPATANPQPAPPNVSTLNDPSGTIIANAAIVPAGTDGQGSADVYSSSPTDLIIDINGYYAPPGDLNFNTALGSGSLASNTTGIYNTATGSNSLAANTTGDGNTATGFNGLVANTTGSFDTANGSFALQSNATGAANTAGGYGALQNNTTGSSNTASGYEALRSNSTGNGNTASGANALANNTTGNQNTATGFNALVADTTGLGNTATGSNALASNTTASQNTATGWEALLDNTTGDNDTASGYQALQNNTTGSGNTAEGSFALNANVIGGSNTAIGVRALLANTTGGNNIAVGYNSANNVGNGNSNNIHIGTVGAANDSGTIRIGGSTALGDSTAQTAFFAAGIRGTTTGNSDAIPVVIDSNGQLGTVSSSRRFKEDIQDMGDASSGLLRLRPVTFRYRQPFADGSKPIQYGLIAEEVEAVYPDLVAHSADGQIESVKYQVLDSMLLNEVQKQAAKIEQQSEQNRQQGEEIRLLKERLEALEALLSKSAAEADRQ